MYKLFEIVRFLYTSAMFSHSLFKSYMSRGFRTVSKTINIDSSFYFRHKRNQVIK